MKHTLIAVPLAALTLAAPAEAATAYMSGLGGTQPGYSTITGPNGERVNTGWRIFGGDEQIRWNTVSQDDAVRAQIAWLEQHQDEDNTMWTYSASANAINEAARLRPDLFTRTTVISLAPPRPGSLDYFAPPAPSTFRQYQVIVTGDSVADPTGKSFDTHLNGYRNLNLQTAVPTSSTVLHDTNTTRSTYTRPAKTSSFKLLDMRTWFAPKNTAVGRAAPLDTEETQLSRSVSAAERPTAAERRKARQAERAERAEKRAAVREARRAHVKPPAAAHASVGADSAGGDE